MTPNIRPSAVAILISLLAACSGSASTPPTSTATTPSTSPSGTGSPTASASASPSESTPAALQPIGPVPARTYALLGTSDGSLLLASNTGRILTRVDPSSGEVLAQRDLGHGGGLAAVEAGGSIWVLQRSKEGTRLIGLAPQTLAILYGRAFAATAEGLAATDGHLWLGVGSALAEIDPGSGSTMGRVRLIGRVGLVAGDPDGGIMYVSLEEPVRKDRRPLLELDGSTGDVLASAWAGYADLNGVSHLVPAPNGVWVGEPTGMMGTLGFYATTDLGGFLVPPRAGGEGTDGHGMIFGSNGISGAYAGSHLWVAYGEGTVNCADARTGRTLGTLTDGSPPGSADIVTVGDHPMTVVDSTLYAIDEEIACS